MEAVFAFAATLLALRLAGALVARWRARRAPELAAWAASLVCYALASAAVAVGTAVGWDEWTFRVYYLFGGLLTAPLLGAGSLLLVERRWATPVALAYSGLAVGLALAMSVDAVSGTTIPDASEHLAPFPARIVAIAGNTLGTVAVLAVAIATVRRRPLGNLLIASGTLVAAVGSGVAGLGVAETSAFVAVAALLLYGGFRA